MQLCSVQSAQCRGLCCTKLASVGSKKIQISLIDLLRSFEMMGGRTWGFTKLCNSSSTQALLYVRGIAHHFPTFECFLPRQIFCTYGIVFTLTIIEVMSVASHQSHMSILFLQILTFKHQARSIVSTNFQHCNVALCVIS